MLFTKAAVGWLFVRLQLPKPYVYTAKITILFTIMYSVGSLFFEIFQCNPVAAQWDFSITDRKCLPPIYLIQVAYVYGSLSTVTDWLFALMPLPIIWKLELSIQTKCCVIGALCLGML